MLRKMTSRRSWTMPDIRRRGDHMPLTKRGAMLQVVKEERKIYDLESSRIQSHQGHDTRRSSNPRGAIGSARGGDGVTGMRNNSNPSQMSRSRPGAVSPWARTEEEVMSRSGSSYYHSHTQRSRQQSRSRDPVDSRPSSNFSYHGQNDRIREQGSGQRGFGAHYGRRQSPSGHYSRPTDKGFFNAWGPSV